MAYSFRPKVVLFALLLSCFIYAPPARADDLPKQKITIAPATAEISVSPGGTAKGRITVANQGSLPFTLRLHSTPYSVVGIEYRPEFKQLPGTTNPDSWVVTSRETPVLLSPTRVIDIDFTVTVPAGTQPGGYYAVLFAESATDKDLGNGVATLNRAGQVLYITVEGPVKREGSVTGSSLGVLSFDPVLNAPVNVKNTGGLHFVAKYSLDVYDIFGRIVWTKSMERYVLPQTERRIAIEWQNNSVFGVYRLHRQVELVGRTDQLPDHWMVAMYPLVALVIVVFLAFLIFRYLRSWFFRNNVEKRSS